MNYDDEYPLLPRAKSFELKGGKLDFKIPLTLALPDDLKTLRDTLGESYGRYFKVSESGTRAQTAVRFVRDADLGAEEYELEIEQDTVIRYGEANGAFYALMTLRQLLINGTLPRCRISDAPSLKLRGYMLDVSRGKIPKISSLKETADLLASLKYNHFQLYFEGLPYAYPGYEEYALSCAYTPAETEELAAYCKARFIDLAPNLNTLGHMSDWLAVPRFKPLAEKEDGLNFFNFNAPPTTLDCENPESLELAVSLIDGLIPYFQSDFINVGLDEPFELGKGKNAAKARQVGVNRLYLDYVEKLHAAIAERKKTMMMWGDIVARDLESAKDLPDDIVLLEWGYQAEYPFCEHAEALCRLGKNFILCPGTSSWLSIGGITDNMTANVASAAVAAHKFGATGMILTDWGDGGHLQCSEISYPALLIFAESAWNARSSVSENDVCDAINRFIFFDKAEILGKLVFDIGRYSNFEEIPLDCRTVATLPLMFPDIRGKGWDTLLSGIVKFTLETIAPDLKEIYKDKMERRKNFDTAAFEKYIDDLTRRLSKARPQCGDGVRAVSELKNAVRLIRALTRARLCLEKDGFDPETANELDAAAEEFLRLRQVRNRVCGVDKSFENIKKLASNLRGR